MQHRRHPLALALITALAAGMGMPGHALAQSEPAEESGNVLDQVVITGTRVLDRTAGESLSPIDIIPVENLLATGTTELATALSRVLPSLNFPRPAITDATSSIRPAQLRGLAPDQVLVLVNGKRRHVTALLNVNGSQGRGSSPVDLNSIPIAAVERIEVLRDGASAQYGSDAIAGVINVVLKNAASGGSADLRYGQYSAGDGQQWQGSTNLGFAVGEGFINLTLQAGDQDATNRARPFNGTPTATTAAVGQKAFIYGDPENEHRSVLVNAGIPIHESLDFYAFASASRRDLVSFAFFRAPRNPNQNILSIYPDGFVPQIGNVSDDHSLVAGLRGELASGLRWDLSFNHGRNQLDFHTLNSLNASLGPGSPTAFYSGALESRLNVVNLDFSRALDLGLEYPANLAFGAEYREDRWSQSAGEPDSWRQGPLGPPIASGAQGFPGFRPSDAGSYQRDNYAVYLDLEASLSERLSTGAALRYEDYSDFGSQTSGKLSARYAFTDSTALRATVASGFRAPSLSQQNFQTTSTTFIAGNANPFEIRTFRATSEIAQALGAEPLRAEESLSYSLGLSVQPAHNITLTVDAYQVEVDDRIVLSANLTGNIRQFLESRGIFGVTGGRYFTNAVDTRTRGIDLVGNWKTPAGPGELDLTVAYNYSSTDVTRIAPNPQQLQSGGLNLERIDRAERGRIERGFPRDKFILAGTWNVGDFSFNLGTSRYGSFQTTPVNAANDQTYGAKWLVDASASWNLGQWRLTVGADNIFDQYPDENIQGNSNSGQFPYNSASPFGFNGAYFYSSVGVRW